MLVSYSKAAQLASVSRTTIRTYIKSGKISADSSDPDAPKIDTSELLRVFGKLSLSTSDAEVMSPPQEKSTSNAEIVRLRHENEMLREILSVREEQVNDLRRSLLLIEHTRSTVPAHTTLSQTHSPDDNTQNAEITYFHNPPGDIPICFDTERQNDIDTRTPDIGGESSLPFLWDSFCKENGISMIGVGYGVVDHAGDRDGTPPTGTTPQDAQIPLETHEPGAAHTCTAAEAEHAPEQPKLTVSHNQNKQYRLLSPTRFSWESTTT